jgi:hypothetical protein
MWALWAWVAGENTRPVVAEFNIKLESYAVLRPTLFAKPNPLKQKLTPLVYKDPVRTAQ